MPQIGETYFARTRAGKMTEAGLAAVRQAKRAETRKRRIRKTVERLAVGKKPGVDM